MQAQRGGWIKNVNVHTHIYRYINISRYIPQLIQPPTKIHPTKKQELNDSLSLKWYKNCTKCKAKLNLIIKSLDSKQHLGRRSRRSLCECPMLYPGLWTSAVFHCICRHFFWPGTPILSFFGFVSYLLNHDWKLVISVIFIKIILLCVPLQGPDIKILIYWLKIQRLCCIHIEQKHCFGH